MKTKDMMTIDISAKTIVRLFVFIIIAWFLWSIRDIILLLVVAVLISSALEPMAARLQRFKIPRAISVLAVYFFFIAVVGLAFTLLLPPLISEFQALADNLPSIYEKLIVMVQGTGVFQNSPSVVESLQKNLLNVGQFLATTTDGIFSTTKTVFGSIFSILLTLVISFYLVISRDSLYSFVRSIVPNEHQLYTINLIKKAQQKIGNWLIAQVILGLIVGTLVFLTMWLLGVPYALALGLLAFCAEFVPVIGPTLAAIPAVLLALTNSWIVGIAALILFLVIQQVEAHVFVPTIMRRAVGLNPLATIIAMLIGARIAGIVGVLLAVPVATVITLFISDLLNAEKEELSA